ncbi:MAG: CRISPR-associated endonuclease Cas1 [Deltaproteobacteria bacterium]|nr:MAG: CRISPR-associated endonuclease Cas1 [Deltaproteobacteria bacterium]
METHDEESGRGDLVAVRDVNAHVFCPRLFWLKHVEGIWLDNEHTIEGRHVHRRVDRPGGRMPAPGEGDASAGDDAAWETRSLWLSSTALGVTGRIDLVDTRGDGRVMPVDTKKGRSDDGALWAPDRVQLVLQALLLREAGYRVEEVAAWYHAERRRVVVALDDALVAEAEAAVEAARVTREGERAPEPLVGSRRCMGCSLNAACLPDEVRRLAVAEELREPDAEVRRVVPPRADRIPLYVQQQGATVRLSKEEVVVQPRSGEEGAERRVGLGHLGQINVYGQVHVTGPVLRECMDRGVDLNFFSQGGWYRGRVVSTRNRQVHVRAAQFGAVGTASALVVARRLVADKVANGRTLLRRNRGEALDEDVLRDLRTDGRLALEAESAGSLLGHEGTAARRYWGAYSDLVGREGDAFRLRGRTRRPPRDRTNAMLSYAYGMLTKDCVLAVEAVGLDAHCGLYHTAHHGRPSMALDLMEPFRPLVVDSVVLQLVRRRELGEGDFIVAGQEVRLKPRSRRVLIRAYERRMDETVTHPEFGYAITYRQLLQVHARLVVRYLLGELESPPSFRTR